MKKLTGLMMVVSLLLTACGEFQSINKGSNEVLSSLSPYLSEADQKLAQELSAVYEEEITIRENLIDSKTIEIEIEGNVAHLEIINKGDVAFKFNGKNVYFDELENNSLLQSIISSSLIKVSSNTSILSLMAPKKSEAFIGALLSSVFGLVVKGIFNYAVEKVTEKAGEAIGGAVSTIGGSLISGVTGEAKPPVSEVNNAKDTIFNVILNAVISKFTGGSVQLPSTNTSTSNPTAPQVQQPAQNCNLFCNLLGLLVSNLNK